MAVVQIQKLSHRHEQIADWLLANPSVKNLNALCAEMNVSRAWLSVIIRSDVFREYWARRRGDHEVVLRDRLVMKQLDITIKALDKLDDIIADDEVDDRLVLDIATKTAQSLGFEPRARNRTVVTEERVQELTRPVDAGTLATARETFRRITRTENVLPAPDVE